MHDDHQCRGWGVFETVSTKHSFPTIFHFWKFYCEKAHGSWLGQKLGCLSLYKLSSGWLFVLCLKNILLWKQTFFFFKKEELKPYGNVTLKKWKHPFFILLPQIIHIFVHVSLDFLPQHWIPPSIFCWRILEYCCNKSLFLKWLSQTPSSRAWNMMTFLWNNRWNLILSITRRNDLLSFQYSECSWKLYTHKKWSN